MKKHVAATVLQIANPLRQVRCQEVLHEVFGERVEMRRVCDGSDDDLLIELDGICCFAVERRVADCVARLAECAIRKAQISAYPASISKISTPRAYQSTLML